MPDTGLTLFALATPLIALALLLTAAVLAARTRGTHRVGWGIRAVLIAGGMLAAAGVLYRMPTPAGPDGMVSGEMPPVFGLSLMGAALGCGGVLLGLLHRALNHARAGHRRPGVPEISTGQRKMSLTARGEALCQTGQGRE